jgi:hypothetical protein|nr:MAG TPA: hypothetical protein [Caudoviricetes sp.]
MGFTTPCFIRKNTPELRKKLEELGYKLNNGKWMGKYLAAFQIKETKEWRYVASPEWDLQNNPDIDASIDCGTNEELFLAIASLRDDTNNNQLFTNDKGDWGIYRDGSDGGLSGMDFYGMPNDFEIDNYHKATVNELIEHFKTKEEQR